MLNEDARSLPGAAQAALRTRAVQAVLDGMTQVEAARVFGVHPNAVGRWIKRYRQGGWAALAERRRGRRAGEQAALTAGQQEEVIALVRETTPDQLGLAGLLWTRDAVAELITQRYGMGLARTTVGGCCAPAFLRMAGTLSVSMSGWGRLGGSSAWPGWRSG
jgi:transposase